jgi:hypothetical protein
VHEIQPFYQSVVGRIIFDIAICYDSVMTINRMGSKATSGMIISGQAALMAGMAFA